MSEKPESQDRAKRGPDAYCVIILALAMLAGYGLRVFRLDGQSLWYDEGYSLELAQMGFASLIATTAADIHPPLYYFLVKAWIGFTGFSEFSARYLSLLFGMLAIPAGYAVAARLIGKPVALTAAALAALSPLYIHYSQEVRMYTLMGLASQLAIYFFLKATSTKRTQHWAGYVVFMVIALYSHLYAGLIFVFLNAVFLLLAAPSIKLRRKGWRGSDAPPYVLSQAAVLLLFAPWLQVVLDKFANYTSPSQGSTLSWILEQTVIVFSLGHSVLGITSFPGQPGYEQDWSLALALSLPFVAVAALGTFIVIAGKPHWQSILSPLSSGLSQRQRALISLAYLILPLCTIILLSMGRRDFNARYLFAVSPAYYLLMAAGMVALGKLRLGRSLLAVVSVVILGAWGVSLNNYYFIEKYSRDDHRSAVAYLRRNGSPGDLVVLDAVFEPVYKYYAGNRFPWIRFPESIPPDPERTIATLAKIVPEHQRVWLVMWGDYFVDPDRIVQRWLDINAFPVDGQVFHGPVIVNGYVSKTPVLAQPPQPEVPLRVDFADQLTLLGYDLMVEEDEAKRRAHLTLYWQAQQKMPANYSIFAQLVNSAGQIVAMGDSQPVNGRLPTTLWEPGQIIRSEMSTWVFPAVPPGAYRLLIGVYDQITMQRLETNRGDTVDVGTVLLSQRTFNSKGLDYEHSTAVQFGDAIQLLGYRTDQLGDSLLSLTMFWRAQEKPSRRYSVFNHLVDSAGNIVSQRDSEPGAGSHPTDQWEPGEVIRDTYYIDIPANRSGDLRLLSGLYDRETGERLAIRHWWPLAKRETAYELEKITDKH